MADVTPRTTRGLSRRTLLRNGLVTGLGVAIATAAVPAFTGVARAASVTDFGIQPGTGTTFEFSAQTNWWWCNKCSGLFWSNSSGSPAGDCAKDGNPHTSTGSWTYDVPFGNPAITGVQSQWSYCNLCDGLFYGPNVSESACIGNSTVNPIVIGNHHRGTTDYDLLHDGWGGGGPFLQGGWNWCTNCQELFWGGNGGACPAWLGTQGHLAGSPNTNYQLFTPQTR